MSSSKIILGTAQFINGYGIMRDSSQYNENEFMQILDFALDTGIYALDTANAYGDAEKIIGKFGAKKFKIISKIPKRNRNSPKLDSWIDMKLEETLDNLDLSSLFCLHFHDASEILQDDGEQIINKLNELKKMNVLNNIGVSIYNSQDLRGLLEKFKPDIIQVPLNIFDRRLINDGTLENLRKKNIEIHVRSIFLQGLLLASESLRPQYFKRWENLFKKWDDLNNNDIDKKIANSLSFAIFQKNISKVIVGVDNLDQFKNLMMIYDRKLSPFLSDLKCDDEELIDPRMWKI